MPSFLRNIAIGANIVLAVGIDTWHNNVGRAVALLLTEEICRTDSKEGDLP